MKYKGYAGRVCPKCGKGCNSDRPITDFPIDVARQVKRYGSEPCYDCMIEILGGKEKVDRIRQENILKEMGIKTK